jgi:membrane protein implicated in regulation of membrane protease activity
VSRAVLTLLAVLALAAWPAAVRAQTPPQPAATPAPETEAARVLDEARDLFKRTGDATRARALFERSYELEPSWRALNGIALMLETQGAAVEAIVAYERLLVEFAAELDDEQRTRLERRVERLRGLTGVLVVDAAQTGAFVTFDGESLGKAPLHRELRVMPGKHVVVATLAGHVPLSPTIEIRAGQTRTVPLHLDPVPVRVEVEDTREVRLVPAWLPWTTLGAGLLMAGAGYFTLRDAQRDADDFDAGLRAGWGDGQAAAPRAEDPLLESAREKHTIGVSLAITGGAIAVTGVVLAVLNRPRVHVTRRLPRLVLGAHGFLLGFDL